MIKHLTIIIKNLNFKLIQMLDNLYNRPESSILNAIITVIIIEFKDLVQTKETSYCSMPP